MDVNMKIAKLRELMKRENIDAYIIPSSDPHMSEYVPAHWKSREWISGFDGSAGTFVATMKESLLWTDGRYYIQAEKQLSGSEVKLCKMGAPGVPTYTQWLADNLGNGETVGFSGKTSSVSLYREMEKKFSPKGILINKSHDFIEEIWSERPGIPTAKIFEHDIKFAGFSTKEKLETLRQSMKKENADFYLVSSLDDIAWLFNIRGDDVEFIPVTVAYALISQYEAFLFINPDKVPEAASETLRNNGVNILAYEMVKEKLEALETGKRIIFDAERTNCWLYDSIPAGCKKEETEELITKLKAIKNSTEIKNLERCQISDGTAMVKFLAWLEKNVEGGRVNEVTVAEKLKEFRAQQPDNIGPSFNTIAAYKEHGAMMHYSATNDSKYTLENKGLMVLDSGGQYLCGTTDITRTVVFDDITEEEKFDFTMVLKSHIALSSTKFLHGATGSNLDVLARKPLWELGIDYKCGTGHGVGYCLSVHEGPQRFSQVPNTVKLEKDMVITIEPGIYKEGKYGIRTENMVLVVEDEKTEFGQFMRFEPMTLCPISLKGINPHMLTEQEKSWLNSYHKKVFDKLSPNLDNEEKQWLRENTKEV